MAASARYIGLKYRTESGILLEIETNHTVGLMRKLEFKEDWAFVAKLLAGLNFRDY